MATPPRYSIPSIAVPEPLANTTPMMNDVVEVVIAPACNDIGEALLQ